MKRWYNNFIMGNVKEQVKTWLADSIEVGECRIFRVEDDPQGNHYVLLNNQMGVDFSTIAIEMTICDAKEEVEIVIAMGKDWSDGDEVRLYFTTNLETIRTIRLDLETLIYVEKAIPMEEQEKPENGDPQQSQATSQDQSKGAGGVVRELRNWYGDSMKQYRQQGWQIFGIAGLLLWISIPWLSWSVYHLANGGSVAVSAVFLTGACLVAGVILIGWQVRQNFRYRRYRTILSPDANERSIDQIATMMKLPSDVVMKDLQRMVELKFFPDGFVDPTNRRFVLDRNRPYGEGSKATTEKKEEEQKKKPKESDFSLEELAQQVSDEGIRDRLGEIQRMTEKIRTQEEKNPSLKDKADVRKFTEYYLTQVADTVNDYLKIGEEHRTEELKARMMRVLDDVSEAANNVWEGLYAGKISDITVEMDVLKAMLAKDGYLNSDFDLSGKSEQAEGERV